MIFHMQTINMKWFEKVSTSSVDRLQFYYKLLEIIHPVPSIKGRNIDIRIRIRISPKNGYPLNSYPFFTDTNF